MRKRETSSGTSPIWGSSQTSREILAASRWRCSACCSASNPADLVHLLQRLEGGGHGHGEVGGGGVDGGQGSGGVVEFAGEALGKALVRGRVGGRGRLGELAQQQTAQAVEREQRVGGARGGGQVRLGGEAGGGAAFGLGDVDVLAVGLAHGIAHGPHAALLEAPGQRGVERAQLVAQRLGHLAHPVVPHLGAGLHLRHHGLQRLQEDFGAQRVVLGQHLGQAQGGAHQGVEVGQRAFHGRGQDLAGAGALHAFADLGLIHQLKLVEVDGEQRAGGFLALLGLLVQRLAQRVGVALAHHGGQPRELLPRVEHGLVLARGAGLVLACLQGQARGFDEALHQGPGVRQHVLDEALAECGGCGVLRGHWPAILRGKKGREAPFCFLFAVLQPPWNLTTSGTTSSATMLMILISGLMAGPAVSL